MSRTIVHASMNGYNAKMCGEPEWQPAHEWECSWLAQDRSAPGENVMNGDHRCRRRFMMHYRTPCSVAIYGVPFVKGTALEKVTCHSWPIADRIPRT